MEEEDRHPRVSPYLYTNTTGPTCGLDQRVDSILIVETVGPEARHIDGVPRTMNHNYSTIVNLVKPVKAKIFLM